MDLAARAAHLRNQVNGLRSTRAALQDQIDDLTREIDMHYGAIREIEYQIGQGALADARREAVGHQPARQTLEDDIALFQEIGQKP